MKSLLTAALLLSTVALAQVPATCDTQRPVDKYQHLRRLSLDLRGHVPSYEEYVALDSLPEVPASTVTQWVASNDFRLVMRKYHEDLFWPNVSTVKLNNTNAQLTQRRINSVLEPAMSLVSTGRRARWRGVADANTTHGLQCGDFAATLLPGNDKRPDPASLRITNTTTPATKQEGWRLVHPYWEKDPTVMIQVCAYDAQETEMSPMFPQYSCGDYRANNDPACGCGKNLKFCFGPAPEVADIIRADMREQLGLLVDTVSTGNKPYTDLVRTRTLQQSPALDFWKKNLAQNMSLANVYSVPDETEPTIPDRDFTATTANTWRPVDRGSDMHAGALTSAAFLLRFQTNRARANRYRIDFECEAFVPPSTIETAAAGCAESGTDLTGRCTCRYCHQTLEPLAAHWGQFTEAGTYLMAPPRFPLNSSTCIGSGSQYCGRFYVTNATDVNPGRLLPYQYADASAPAGSPHKNIATNIAAGPRALVDADLASTANDAGKFAKCTAKRAFEYLMKREMHTQTPLTDEVALQQQLAADFKNNNYSLPKLFEAIVARPEYRSIR